MVQRTHFSILIPENLLDLIRKSAKSKGLSLNALVLLSMSNYLEQENEKRLSRRERRTKLAQDDTPAPRGLFSRHQRFVDDSDTATAPAAPEININVSGGSSSEGGQSISAMARYVVEGGAEYLRDERLREVCEVLKCAPASEHEKLAESLSKSVESLDKATKEAKKNPSPFNGYLKWLKK